VAGAHGLDSESCQALLRKVQIQDRPCGSLESLLGRAITWRTLWPTILPVIAFKVGADLDSPLTGKTTCKSACWTPAQAPFTTVQTPVVPARVALKSSTGCPARAARAAQLVSDAGAEGEIKYCGPLTFKYCGPLTADAVSIVALNDIELAPGPGSTLCP
jgi:hypothetical protein